MTAFPLRITESSLIPPQQEIAVPTLALLISRLPQPARWRWGLAGAAVLIAGQLLAVAMLAQNQVQKAAQRDAVRLSLRTALAQCVEAGTPSTLDACLLRARQAHPLAGTPGPAIAQSGVAGDMDRPGQAPGLMAVSLVGGN